MFNGVNIYPLKLFWGEALELGRIIALWFIGRFVLVEKRTSLAIARMFRLVDKRHIRNHRYFFRTSNINSNMFIDWNWYMMAFSLRHWSSFLVSLCFIQQLKKSLIVYIQSISIDMNWTIRRGWKIRNMVLIMLLIFRDKWIGFWVESGINNRLIVRNTHIIIEIAETVVTLLANRSLFFAHYRLILVNNLLNDLKHHRIEIYIHLLRLDNRLDHIATFLLFFVIILQSMQSLLVQSPFTVFSSMLLDVLLLLAGLILTATHHTKYRVLNHLHLAQFSHLRFVHPRNLRNCLPRCWPANHSDWLRYKIRMQVWLALRIERLLVLRIKNWRERVDWSPTLDSPWGKRSNRNGIDLLRNDVWKLDGVLRRPDIRKLNRMLADIQRRLKSGCIWCSKWVYLHGWVYVIWINEINIRNTNRSHKIQ